MHDGSHRRRKGQRRALGVGLLALALAGCREAVPPREAHIWADAYLFGTLGEREFDVRDVCGERGAERLEVLATPGTVLLSFATLGVYTPHEVQFRCR